MADTKIKKQTTNSKSISKGVSVSEDAKIIETTNIKSIRRIHDKNITGDKVPSKFFVVELNGRQEIVWEGLEMSVDKLNEKKFDGVKILMSVDGDKVEIGKPYLSGKVNFEKVQDYLGEKVITRVYKAKSRYHRTRGKREHKSLLKVQA